MEIYWLLYVQWLKFLAWQDRMPQNFSEQLWRLEDVLTENQQLRLNLFEVFEAVLRVVME